MLKRNFAYYRKHQQLRQNSMTESQKTKNLNLGITFFMKRNFHYNDLEWIIKYYAVEHMAFIGKGL